MIEKLSERLLAVRDKFGMSHDDAEILDAAAAALRENAWRPIETAPKDGTPVLGCIFSVTGGWHEEYEQWRAPVTISYRGFHPNAPGKKQWRVADGKPYPPTHWRPMLAAPVPLDAAGSAEGVADA